MCGIFGFSGKEGKKADLLKLRMLGVYNVQRGVDSCGYYYNGNIKKGIDGDSNWGNWVVKEPIAAGDLDTEVFIGHTRKSTVGKNTADNAHPHVIDNDYVQTHNGVIHNKFDLCKLCDLKAGDYEVDSQALAACIDKVGFLKPLTAYTGFAALAITRMSDPKKLYLYHGASRSYSTDKLPFIERPLFLIQTEDGVYYSSLKESLQFIEPEAEIIDLPCNAVFTIENGVYDSEKHERIYRKDANLTSSKYDVETNTWTEYVYTAPKTTTQYSAPARVLSLFDNDDVTPLILTEAIPAEWFTQDIYFRYGRFIRSHDILLNGKYIIDRKGKMVESMSDSVDSPETYWFISGIMMKSEKDYNTAKDLYGSMLSENNPDRILSYHLSKYARYPLTLLKHEWPDEGSARMRKRWFSGGKPFKGSFTPKFSRRVYKIDSDGLKSISSPNPTETIYGQVYHYGFTFRLDTEILLKHFLSGLRFSKFSVFPETKEIDAKPEDIILRTFKNRIKTWASMRIFENNIIYLPEFVLMVLDHAVATSVQEELSTEISEAETERLVSNLLWDCIDKKISIGELLKKEKLDKYLEPDQIEECFKTYDLEEIEKSENRYKYIEFKREENSFKADSDESPFIEDIIDQSTNLTSESEIADKITEDNVKLADKLPDIINQFAEIEGMADDIQCLENSEPSQDVAYMLYKVLDLARVTLQQVVSKEQFSSLKNELIRVKSLNYNN